MIEPDLQNQLERIGALLDGEMHVSSLMRNAYSTDASVYRETPLAVAIPRTDGDIQRPIKFAGEHQGQAVGTKCWMGRVDWLSIRSKSWTLS